MPINVELLQKTLQYIKEHPEEWDQKHWRCGTVACFAGRAAILSGARWESDGSYGCYVVPENQSDEDYLFVGAYAQEILGLSDEEADELFWSENSLETIERTVAALVAVAETKEELV